MLITVTLKDANGNVVSGAASLLTADTVTVANAMPKGSRWKDNSDGTYTEAYRATTAGMGLKATVKMSGWGNPVESGAYAITAITLEDISVNEYTFASNAGPDNGLQRRGVHAGTE
ncbi:Ig-like domain-containing protein [Hafnia paralvei]|nr:Ig-like domain-containing protein [Hafnia paralvei]MCK2182013.1 Ig-like domain-containing protein [Hafnia paralvei]